MRLSRLARQALTGSRAERLQRLAAARDRQRSSPRREPAPPPGSAAERHLVDRFTQAFEAADIGGILALLTEDVWLTMPPLPLEYQGPELAGQFLAATAFRPGWTARLIPARANGHPAFGAQPEARPAYRLF